MSCKKAFFLLKKVVYYLIVLSVVFNLFGFYNSPKIAYAVSGVPFTIGYQGRLTNSSGDLLGGSGTTFYFKFSIYDASSGGNKLWPSSAPSEVSATVRQGVFNVNIGDTKSGYPDQLNYNFNSNNTVYLQVSVSSSSGGSFQDLTPRQLIAASAFAQLSSAVSGTTTPSSFGTTSPFSSATHVSIEASTTASIPLGIRAISGQTADLFQIQEPNDGVSRITVDSGFRFGVGTSSIGSDLGLFGLAVEGSSLIGNYLTTSFITATSTTATSTFKGGVLLARDAGTVGIGTSTPTGTFAVSGNSYFSGGVTLGTSNTDATTTPGHLRATLLHSDTTIVAGGLISCTGDIETDANGVFHCGTDQTGGASSSDLQDAYNNSAADAQITTTDNKNLIFFSDNTATDANIVVALHSSGGGQFQVADSTGSATTTRLVITRDGSLGIGTTSPGGAFAVGIASTTILNGNLYVLSTTTVGALNATNTLSVASSSPGSGVNLAVLGHSVLGGNLSVTGALDAQGAATFGGSVAFQNSATTTFSGGVDVTTTGGLSSASGITLSGGDLLLSSGKITQSSSATSTIPNFNGSTLINAGSIFVSGAGTSTIVNADELIKGNLTVGTGLNLNGGDLVVTGKIVSSNSATSSYTGGVSAAGLASSQGVTISAGDLLFSGSGGKIFITGTATSTLPQLSTSFITTQSVSGSSTALSLGQTSQNTAISGSQIFFTPVNNLFVGTSTVVADTYDVFTIEATSTVSNVLTLRGFGSKDDYAGTIFQVQDSTGTTSLSINQSGSLGIGTSTFTGVQFATSVLIADGSTLYVEGTTTAASLIATSTLGVGTSTPSVNAQLAVLGNTYLTGGLSIGASATTVPGSVQSGGLGDFVTGLIVRNLVSCTGDIETDAAGLLHCGTDVSGGASSVDLQDAYDNSAVDAQITTTNNKNLIFFSDNTATDANIVVALHSSGGGQFQVADTTGSATTTRLVITRDGSTGIGTTSPGGAFAVGIASTTILNGNLYTYGQLTLPNFIATTTSNNGVGTTSTTYAFGIGGFGVVKGNFNIEATSTASSFNASSTLSVGTSSPNFASTRFNVQGNAFINGGLALGDTSATTAPGQLRATLLHSDTQIVAEGIPSCSGSSALQSDAAGVIKCGAVSATASPGGNDTQVQYNNATVLDGLSLFTFSNSTGNVTIGGDLFVNGADFNLGTGKTATTTLTAEYGRLGFGSTTPFGQVSIESVQGVVGSSTPIFVIGDSGTATPFFLVSGINGNIGIGTTSPMEGLTVASTSILQTPKQPRAVGGVDMAGDTSTGGIYVVGRYAYVGRSFNVGECSGSTLTGCEVIIYDVSDPTSPVALGGIEAWNNVQRIFVSGRYAYIVKAASSQPCSGASTEGCELTIIDVANPASSTPISGVDFGGTVWGEDVFVSGRYAYVSKDQDTGTCSGTTLTGCELSIYDVSDPYNPTAVSGINLGSAVAAEGIYVAGSYLYITSDGNTDTCSGTTITGCEFSIYDISDITSPKPKGGVNIANGVVAVKVSGRYAYITQVNNISTCSGATLTGCEFSIYDISNPSSPTAVGGVDFGVTLDGLYISGRYAYLGTFANSISPCNASTGLIGCEFAVYDISDPSVPIPVGGINSDKPTGIRVTNIKVAGHYAYIAKGSTASTCSGTELGGCEFAIYDVMGMESPSGIFHSLEAGDLQVRNNIIAQGYLQVTDSIGIGNGGLLSQGPISVIGTTTVADNIAAFFGGKVGIASTTPGTKLDVLGSGLFKGGLYVQATTTTSSLIASSTLAVATSSPATNAVLNVGGNTYLSGGLSVGTDATTSPGDIKANLLHSDTQIVALGLINCDSIDTDLNGVLKCGVDSTGAGGTITGSGTTNTIMKWTASSQAGDSIMTDLNGNIGLSSTTPGAKLSVMGNEIIAATSTASAFLATSSLGVATTSLGGNVQFAVNGNAYITGGLVVGGASSTPGFRMSATTTGLTVAGNLQLLNPEKKTTGGKFDLCWSSSDYTISIIDVLGNDCNATTDVSEKMVTTEDVEEADTVSLIPMLPGQVRDDYNTFAVEKSKLPYDTKAIGIVARYGKTHILGGDPDSNPANLLTAPISLAGRTPAKVSLENGPIHLGDRLTTASNKPGHLMKATKSGWVVGIALEELATSATETGKILVFLDPFSWKADNGQDNIISLYDQSAATILQNADIVASGTPMSFVINQKGSGDILQLQQNDTNRFLVHNDGTTEINAKVVDGESVKKLLVVKSNDDEVFSINARGDTAVKGVITIGNDSFAGSIATNDQGYAQVNFSYPLGTGKPSVQLTPEGEEVALAQVYKFVKDDSQNYIGFIIRAIKYASGQPAANLNVDYLVTGKEDGYNGGLTGPITLPVSTSPITFPPIIISEQQSSQNTPTNTTDTPTSSTPPVEVTDTEPPVITINGLNPTEIEIGAAYSDLGVTVTDNVSQNLGYKMSLDGGLEVYPSEFQLDTSIAGEHTITYKATDQAGNTTTATRQVTVFEPSATSGATTDSTPNITIDVVSQPSFSDAATSSPSLTPQP